MASKPSSASELRIGSGFDIHRLVEGRRLVLGGIEIAYSKGLDGHSDADALLHALVDAVLGALCWGDIGSWFPDNDAQYKDADSKFFFRAVWEKAQAEGWQLVNCDATVLIEKPILRPYIESMRSEIAALFAADISRVSVKATRSEKMSFVGREEGAAVSAVVLLSR